MAYGSFAVPGPALNGNNLSVSGTSEMNSFYPVRPNAFPPRVPPSTQTLGHPAGHGSSVHHPQPGYPFNSSYPFALGSRPPPPSAMIARTPSPSPPSQMSAPTSFIPSGLSLPFKQPASFPIPSAPATARRPGTVAMGGTNSAAARRAGQSKGKGDKVGIPAGTGRTGANDKGDQKTGAPAPPGKQGNSNGKKSTVSTAPPSTATQHPDPFRRPASAPHPFPAVQPPQPSGSSKAATARASGAKNAGASAMRTPRACVGMDELIKQNNSLKAQVAAAKVAREREEMESGQMLETLSRLMGMGFCRTGFGQNSKADK
ncbi:hypothetical protein HDU96_009867 [Phlyctochytrium bullatum]|nr:hypothetical protein HDU96_009867 [Phlyctochytrium bullatum]